MKGSLQKRKLWEGAEQQMLVPWRINKRNVPLFLAQLSTFNGLALVYSQQAEATAPQNVSDRMREEISQQVSLKLENEHHIWLASGQRNTLYAFLHAIVLPDQEARVEILCSIEQSYNRHDKPYQGFGELGILCTLLEERGINKINIPLYIDMVSTELDQTGWREGATKEWLTRS